MNLEFDASEGRVNTADADATPMMAQYLKIKAAHPDSLLFYRMGDFYEMFFDDAVAAAEALGIALTKRGQHRGEDIPMCGVPVHAADEYLQTLIRKGFRVAVCEQMEDPAEARKRGYKAVVRRDVVRLVTPGTLTEDSLLESGRNNNLAALGRHRGADALALAWADISTGAVTVMDTQTAALASHLAQIEPGEILVPDTLDDDIRVVLEQSGIPTTALPASRFESVSGERHLKEVYSVASLAGFGDFTRSEVGALGALLGYVELTQVGRLPALQPPRRVDMAGALAIDPATRANLELTRTLGGERAGSLLSHIDFTVTSAGARLLANRLAAPSTDPEAINARLDAVDLFCAAGDLRAALRKAFRQVPDLARPLSRLSLGRGGPRDLGAIRSALVEALALPDLFGRTGSLAPPPAIVADAVSVLENGPRSLRDQLAATLADDLPVHARDGGFVAAGVDPALDEARALRDKTRQVIAGLQARYRDDTAIKSLKVKHNNVLGYFVEVPSSHGPTLMAPPYDALYVHRQTMANAMRFTTGELADLELRIAEAAATALRIEEACFQELATAVVEAAPEIMAVADAVATLDVASALAELSVTWRYVRPVIRTEPVFEIEGGRHPVVEQALRRARQGPFVANDCALGAAADRGAIWLVTGPNMAGKSTFLRQNALIAILAQIGSHVPAARAEIGIVDRLFSRVGASDDLAGGRSTFMVEMVETAAILNQAGPRALVILDEIGRGTATFDGLAIAWASLEHLHQENRCRTLFATHFHELTALADTLDHVSNVTVRVSEYRGDVVFLHEVVPGAADRSYGIQVARLAGLPAPVTDRAAAVLEALEDSDAGSKTSALIDDLPLFSAPRPRAPARESVVEERLASVMADELTPRQALDLVYELKASMAHDQEPRRADG